ncbi:MAG: xylose isomerase [Planctomycetes bacterium]|nr:xylose isomerase [Planctomycetota bacterium]
MPLPRWKTEKKFTPRRSDRFAFGIWCVMNRGRDPFGEETRPRMDALDAVRGLAKKGCASFEFHDDDLVSPAASLKEREKRVRDLKRVMAESGIAATMATCNLTFHKCFKDGAFTSNDARVRAYALQKTMRLIDLAAQVGAEIIVFWGGREGVEVEASKSPQEALRRYREAINFLSHYVRQNRYEPMRFAIEPKPNEPRGDLFLPTAGHVLGFIPTCDHPDMLGVNPEIEHCRMQGLNACHDVAQCLEAGKLFDIHLGAQKPLRFDQDMRFGAEDLKETFFIVKLLEDAAWPGTRTFDAHPYRTEDEDGVWDFVDGCLRAYLILKEKVARWNADPAIRALREEIACRDPVLEAACAAFSPANAQALLARHFDPDALAAHRLRYEVLDQLTQEVLLGVR